ncbi:gpW family head-tail joining protein [Nissabacter sp. SGAir0207]|uniref:gpW family head-tail joining protein n=1 Tax=Nissabacter sp. SGAir0207 TaxID=2126321 RepID=UPI0010CD4943|nr:gpW family head-tail joining protein [Nissabacter sp. SGAir0207]QCR38955.1 phage head-tail adapter protein [Nissabacter sp. SGAir0207]
MQTPNSGLLAGMSPAQLKKMLADAQTAYGELLMGKKGVSFSYTQGDGTRSVTYQPTSVADVTSLIQQLQKALGMRHSPRRAMRFRY